MDKETNIRLAKQYMVESIYRSANVEGIGVTFPETQVICEGMSVAGHTVEDINAVTDLKKAWQWVFANVDEKISVQTLKKVNQLVGKYTVINAGIMRTEMDFMIRVPTKNGDYYPPLPPKEEVIEKEISEMMETKDLQSALELFCYIAKGQFFNNGNKRTATVFVNLYMIQNGIGIFSIPVQKKLEFYELLADFYENEEKKESLKCFLEEFCITPPLGQDESR